MWAQFTRSLFNHLNEMITNSLYYKFNQFIMSFNDQQQVGMNNGNSLTCDEIKN